MDEAQILAQKLDALNVERRKIESEMSEQANLALEHVQSYGKNLPIALCLMDKSWHQGVIGILAGRLKDKYNRPVFAFAQVSDHELKGSARSIHAVNIRDVLAAMDKDNPGLMTKFGGHAMAAGLSLPPEHFLAFKEALLAEMAKHIDPLQSQGELFCDGSLSVKELQLEFAQLLNDAGPWGQQFPEPLFDNVFEILDQRLLAQKHLKLTLVHPQGGEPLDAIAFNVDLKQWPNHRARYLRMAYRLDINEYKGRRRLQLIVVAMELTQDAVLTVCDTI